MKSPSFDVREAVVAVSVAMACLLAGACAKTPAAPSQVPTTVASPVVGIKVDAISPAQPTEDDGSQTLTVTGTNLGRVRKVLLTVPSASSTTLDASTIVSQSDTSLALKVALETTGQYALALGDGDHTWSNTLAFSVAAAPPPAIVSVSPSALTEGADAQALQVVGTGFRAAVSALLTSPLGQQTVLRDADIRDRTATSFRLVVTLDSPGTYTLVASNRADRASKPFNIDVQAAPKPCAPVTGKLDPRAPGYIVVFHSGVDVQGTVGALAAKYGFTPGHVYTVVLGGFSAELTDAQLAGVRCEPTVRYIEHNGLTSATGLR